MMLNQSVGHILILNTIYTCIESASIISQLMAMPICYAYGYGLCGTSH